MALVWPWPSQRFRAAVGALSQGVLLRFDGSRSLSLPAHAGYSYGLRRAFAVDGGFVSGALHRRPYALLFLFPFHFLRIDQCPLMP
ncbi:hypothetical protein HC62_12050 [Acetobacter tropicalis]|nr:hypothetical protein HC62_12050 [Acetobacter tropicalis]